MTHPKREVFALTIEFRDRHGRKVSQQQWLRGLEDAVVDEAQKAVEERIRRVRCPDHHEAVRQLRGRRQRGGLRYTWEACCEKLNDAIEHVLA